MSSIDDLFQLPAPAALKRGMNRGKWPYKHGNLAEDMEQFPKLDLGPGWSTHSWRFATFTHVFESDFLTLS